VYKQPGDVQSFAIGPLVPSTVYSCQGLSPGWMEQDFTTEIHSGPCDRGSRHTAFLLSTALRASSFRAGHRGRRTSLGVIFPYRGQAWSSAVSCL
jgi:hypothetical protein